jgi:hypothetical protein
VCEPGVQFGILGRDPPLKHHATRTRYAEQIAPPLWAGGVGLEGAVGTVGQDEICQVG